MKVFYKLLKKSAIEDANRAGHNRQMIGKSTSSKMYPNMGKPSGKRKQRYIPNPRDQSKLTCIIHVPEYSSD